MVLKFSGLLPGDQMILSTISTTYDSSRQSGLPGSFGLFGSFRYKTTNLKRRNRRNMKV
jgi:hypothetical protein